MQSQAAVLADSNDPPPSQLSDRYTNRELSWLAFNERVLAQTVRSELPVLERLKFCSIYASNLDEFFMVRVAGLKDQVAGGVTTGGPDGLSPIAQLQAIRKIVLNQAAQLEHTHSVDLRAELSEVGLEVANWDELDLTDQKAATAEFEARLFPVLTPLAVDPGHPFPYISNLSLNLAVSVSDPSTGTALFARLKVPKAIGRFLQLPSGRLVPVEQIIGAHLDQLFPGMEVAGAWPFRVSRNADLTLDDAEADDLLEAVELELRRRRFGRAIRLEINRSMPSSVVELLVRELDLHPDDVFSYQDLVDVSGYADLEKLAGPELAQPMTTGITPTELAGVELSSEFFGRIKKHDILLHHPYDSFAASVSEFVRHASRDPRVLAIKLTLYRTSGDSPIIESLIRAAESGKQVAALIELKARFDEMANIAWARRLEEAGVHVVYGLVGLKIHCKTTLVVRDEDEGLRRYAHIGTGNYNPRTARYYEDLGLLTADLRIGNDLSQMYNFLTGYGRDVSYERLLVAPTTLRPALLSLIDNEIACGAAGHIFMKMNSLVDPEIIERLYSASEAGVKVELVVRGVCCLRLGIEGVTENITVRSIVGRYLEHSRIYYFAHGGGDVEGPGYYIGSADLMPRNLDRRVEVLTPVDSQAAQSRIDFIMKTCLADDMLSWELQSDGTYASPSGNTLQSHDEFEHDAAERVALLRESRERYTE